MSEQLDGVLRRMGYVRRDHATGQGVEPRTERPVDRERTAYPQVVMVQGHSTGESWVRDHAGQLMLAAGVGVFALAALAVVALVAIVVAVALVGIATSVAVIRGVAASQNDNSGRGWRR
jgi:hypothetical protein